VRKSLGCLLLMLVVGICCRADTISFALHDLEGQYIVDFTTGPVPSRTQSFVFPFAGPTHIVSTLYHIEGVIPIFPTFVALDGTTQTAKIMSNGGLFLQDVTKPDFFFGTDFGFEFGQASSTVENAEIKEVYSFSPDGHFTFDALTMTELIYGSRVSTEGAANTFAAFFPALPAPITPGSVHPGLLNITSACAIASSDKVLTDASACSVNPPLPEPTSFVCLLTGLLVAVFVHKAAVILPATWRRRTIQISG